MPATTWPAPTVDAPEAPAAPRSERVRRATAATIVAGLATALIGLDRPTASLGVVVIILVVATALTRAATLRGPGRMLMAVGVLAFVPWLAVRSSPWLTVPDVIAAVALVLVALSARNGSGLGDTAAGYRRRLVRLVAGALNALRRAALGVEAEIPADWRSRIRQSLGPAVIGLVVALAVMILLASGDALFASYLDVDGLADDSLPRFVAAVAAMSMVVAGAGAAAAAERRPAIPARRVAAAPHVLVASVPVVAVYMVYVAVQCSSVLLGASYVRDRTGLTFAEYARSGFFQLIAVGTITFLWLSMLRPVVRTAVGPVARALRLVAVIATACTLVMVAAAIVKLDLYADVFGLTMLRLYTTVFAAWLGLALLLGLAAVMRPRGDWLLPVVATTALAGVFAMNVANPERIVAEHNLTETIGSDEFDVDYLLGLSDDAVPAVVAGFDRLDPTEQERARRIICRDARSTDWLDANLAVRRAATAARDVC